MKKYITCIFVSFFIIPIYGQEDLWDVIRENSNFQYSADRSEIQKALKIYQNNQYLVDRLSKNGQRYLYHMVDETLKRDMPVELALLPFVESQFDPYAQSPAGAFGSPSHASGRESLPAAVGYRPAAPPSSSTSQ